MQIGNKEPFPGSFLTIIWFILVSGSISSAGMTLNNSKKLTLFFLHIMNTVRLM